MTGRSLHDPRRDPDFHFRFRDQPPSKRTISRYYIALLRTFFHRTGSLPGDYATPQRDHYFYFRFGCQFTKTKKVLDGRNRSYFREECAGFFHRKSKTSLDSRLAVDMKFAIHLSIYVREAPDRSFRRALRPALHLILRSTSSKILLNYVYYFDDRIKFK